MSDEENIAKTKKAYAAFSAGDIEAAAADLDEAIEWVVSGNSAVSGTYRGKDEVIGFWMKLAEAGFSIVPHSFFGDSDQVVVLSQTKLGDEEGESADVLEFGDGLLLRFRTIGEVDRFERVFGPADAE